jgi:hypothetical protein
MGLLASDSSPYATVGKFLGPLTLVTMMLDSFNRPLFERILRDIFPRGHDTADVWLCRLSPGRSGGSVVGGLGFAVAVLDTNHVLDRNR